MGALRLALWNTAARKFPSHADRVPASVRGEPGIGSRFGTERGSEAGEVLCNDRDVLVLEARREALHDRILASALAVLIDRAHQVVLVLTRERRVHRRNGDTVLAVARDAQRRRLRHAPLRLAGGTERLARGIRRAG